MVVAPINAAGITGAAASPAGCDVVTDVDEGDVGRAPEETTSVAGRVIVDEAGMLPTSKLAELADLADVNGWRVALVGDPLQFSAVGRGGMFGLLVDTFGAIELDRVQRFDNEWEREASLRLRRGDVTVGEVYEATNSTPAA